MWLFALSGCCSGHGLPQGIKGRGGRGLSVRWKQGPVEVRGVDTFGSPGARGGRMGLTLTLILTWRNKGVVNTQHIGARRVGEP